MNAQLARLPEVIYHGIVDTIMWLHYDIFLILNDDLFLVVWIFCCPYSHSWRLLSSFSGCLRQLRWVSIIYLCKYALTCVCILEFIAVNRVPLGVVTQLTAWNHPMLIAIKKIAPALATGNSIVLKPSEMAPVSVLEVREDGWLFFLCFLFRHWLSKN